MSALITMREPDHTQTPLTSGAPGRIARNKREKQERMLRAARRLFGRKGFERTTTREIAEAADIGAGTLFLYAGSKEDLLAMIFRDEVGTAVTRAAAAMRPAPLLDQVMQVFDAIISHHERNFGLARVFVKELPFIGDRSLDGRDEVMRGMFARLGELVENARARGELRADVPADLLVDNLFSLFLNTIQQWLGGRKSPAEHCRARLRQKLDLQLSGLRPAPAGRAVRPASHAARSASNSK